MRTFIPALEDYEKKFVEGKARKRGITIAVSGVSGSGKSTLARHLAEKLKLRYYEAGEILRRLAKERSVPLERLVEKLEENLDLEIDRKTLSLAARGGCVIVGRLAPLAAGKYADVRVLVTAPLRVRAKRVSEREKIAASLARKLLRERDEADRKRYEKVYGVDFLSRKHYHIVFRNDVPLRKARAAFVKVVRDFLRKRKLSIAIGGDTGAGSSTVGRLLAKRLNSKFFSVGDLFKKLSKKKAKGETLRAIKTWEDVGKKKEFHEKLDRLQRRIAKKGNCVICAKLSPWVLKDIADYRIWITANFVTRARRVAERDGIPLEEAKKLLRKKERLEREEWRRIYGIDFASLKSLCEIVVDSSKLSQGEIVERILKAIGKR